MKRKNTAVLMALVLVFSLAMTACGKEAAPETTAPVETTAAIPLGLSNWSLTATTWSSPNGATINLSATPYGYVEGRTAVFTVRLEGEDVTSAPCVWDGSQYTASVELNAEDGYCYYVQMQDAEGNSAEIPVNTPSAVTNEAFIDLADALTSYCNLLITESSYADGQLTVASGTVQIQLPKIGNNGESVTCTEAKLVLTCGEEEVASEVLTLEESDGASKHEQAISNLVFEVPQMEGDLQVALRLDVTLSNGQTMTSQGGSWLSSENGVLPVVG